MNLGLMLGVSARGGAGARLFSYAPGTAGGTFTRASTARYRDSVGISQLPGVNVLRDGHYELNPVTGLYERATLLEGARSHGWTFGEQIDNAAWTKAGATITADATIGSDGLFTLDKLVESAGAGEHRFSRVTPALTDSTVSSFSFEAKEGERRYLSLRVALKSGVVPHSTLDLRTGGVTVVGAGITIRAIQLANGVYRYECSFNAGVGATVPTVYWNLHDGVGLSYTGDGVSGAYVGGIQFETDQPNPSSYIPVAAGTRATELLNYPFPYSPRAMTLYARFVERGTLLASGRVVEIGNTSSANPRVLIYATGGTYAAYHHNGTAAVIAGAGINPAIGTLVELRLVLNANGSVQIGHSFNRAAETVSGTTAANTLAAAWSGPLVHINGPVVGFNAFQAVKVARGVKTLAEMRTL